MPPEEILNALELPPARASSLNQLLSVIRMPRPAQSLADQARWVQASRAALNPADRKGAATYAVRRIQSFLASPPGDVHLISEASPSDKDGYAIALRFALQILDSDVAPLPTDDGRTYRRVSTIKSPYVYSIAQQFALVFSSVGLPDDERTSVRLAGDFLVDELRLELANA